MYVEKMAANTIRVTLTQVEVTILNFAIGVFLQTFKSGNVERKFSYFMDAARHMQSDLAPYKSNELDI